MVYYCSLCELEFTVEEWDIRHSNFDGEDIHDNCCEREGPCMYKEEKVGVTHGLHTNCGHRQPEQVYVYKTGNVERPIAVEGWVGYSIDQRLELTQSQAKDLVGLLMEALLGT